MGRVSIVMSVAPAIGPTISGLILSFLSWRWMFWLVLPIALAMLVIGIRRVENVERAACAAHRRVLGDPVGVRLRRARLRPQPRRRRRQRALGRPTRRRCGSRSRSASSASLAFVWRQLMLQRRDRALLDLRTFRSRNFSLSVALMVVMMAALFGTIILLPIYLQNVLGLDPLYTGLLLLPGGLIMGLLGPTVGRLYDRFGPTPLLVPGSIVVLVRAVVAHHGRPSTPRRG